MKQAALKVYLEPVLSERVDRQARALGRSKSSVVAEAVRARFDPARSEAESQTAKRILHRLDRRVDRIVRDQDMVRESLLAFVQVWLEHNPPLDEAIAASAAQSAAARFERFCEFVVRGLNAGPDVLAELEREEAPLLAASLGEAR